MNDKMNDYTVLQRINELVSREHAMLAHERTSEEARSRLRNVQVELDQCWDLLRRRRAFQTVAKDADSPQIRPPETVEQYE